MATGVSLPLPSKAIATSGSQQQAPDLSAAWDPLVRLLWPQFVRDGSAYNLRAVNKALAAAANKEITGGRATLRGLCDSSPSTELQAVAHFHKGLPQLSKLEVEVSCEPPMEPKAALGRLTAYLDALGPVEIRALRIACPMYNEMVVGCQRIGGSVETLDVSASPVNLRLWQVLSQQQGGYPRLRHLRLRHLRGVEKVLAGRRVLDKLEVVEVAGPVTPREMAALTLACPGLLRLCIRWIEHPFLEVLDRVLIVSDVCVLVEFYARNRAELTQQLAQGVPTIAIGVQPPSITTISISGDEVMRVHLDAIGHMLDAFPALVEMHGRFAWASKEPGPGELRALCADGRARSVVRSMGLVKEL
jgi:hypothetical protein